MFPNLENPILHKGSGSYFSVSSDHVTSLRSVIIIVKKRGRFAKKGTYHFSVQRKRSLIVSENITSLTAHGREDGGFHILVGILIREFDIENEPNHFRRRIS